jgi:3D (Asp-Asp-Asp) domain-containing protein
VPVAGSRRGHRRAQQRRQGDVRLQPRAGRGGLPHVRNGQALQWISDWGQASFLVTDASPCQNANYQVYAMKAEDNSPASLGQISTSFRLNASNKLAAFALAKGTTFTYRVSSYNDLAQTALGYNAGSGICAVDARNIPWGTRFYVPGYGRCYADVGSWIKDDIVDVWLPGSQAANWGDPTAVFGGRIMP